MVAGQEEARESDSEEDMYTGSTCSSDSKVVQVPQVV